MTQAALGRKLRLLAPALLAVPVVALANPAEQAAAPEGRDTAFLRKIKPRYPKNCAGKPGGTGLCLLVSTAPRAEGEFRVRPVINDPHAAPAEDQALPVNTILALPPGTYEIYKATGIDDAAPATVTVSEGRITTVQTISLRFVRPGKDKDRAYKLQRALSERCTAEFPRAGVGAYLPGNYLLNRAGKDRDARTCERGGVAFNAVFGQGYRIRPGKVQEQGLSRELHYTHPDQVSALTSVGPFHHGIGRIGWLKHWQSYQGLQNPFDKRSGAVALHGPGSYVYVVPMIFHRNHAKVCGFTLPQGGLPKQPLLTDCKFSRGELTGFTVNPGTVFVYHNLFGQPDIAAYNIQSGFTVDNVQFKLPEEN
jgi:hypothetical protein